MIFHVVFSETAQKELKKLDKYTQKIILLWLNKYLEGCKDPRAHGKPLTTNRVGQWRYRIGDYRLIAKIEDERLVILVIKLGHRREVYDE